MTDYYSIPTTLGAAKIAAAANVNQALTITHMAFGDANGLPYLPVSRVNSTTLLNERHRVAIEYLNQDSANANVYIIKARIPAAIGGFEVNEIGLFDSDGDLIYLANYPRTLKSQITQGAGGELNVKIHIMTSHSSVLTLVLNPNVITLTQENGDGRYALKTELDAEAIARANADLALSIALAAEITNRGNADNAEATARVNADLALSIAIAAEITAREALTLQIMNKVWPLGSVYENEVDMRNPAHADLLGFGTWIPTQYGRFSVGYADTDPQFGGLGWAGGNRNHKMTLANLIEHDHDVELPSGGNGSEYGPFASDAYNDGTTIYTTQKAGSADPDPIPTLPPYVVSAKWRRTA